MLQLFADGRSERVVIGKNLAAGERPQHVVRRGVWQGSRLAVNEGWALLGCTVSPGFEFVDYRDASYAELMEKWPGEAEMIRELTNR
jgi:predicted cupin superfamily sugar epimerase